MKQVSDKMVQAFEAVKRAQMVFFFIFLFFYFYIFFKQEAINFVKPGVNFFSNFFFFDLKNKKVTAGEVDNVVNNFYILFFFKKIFYIFF